MSPAASSESASSTTTASSFLSSFLKRSVVSGSTASAISVMAGSPALSAPQRKPSGSTNISPTSEAASILPTVAAVAAVTASSPSSPSPASRHFQSGSPMRKPMLAGSPISSPTLSTRRTASSPSTGSTSSVLYTSSSNNHTLHHRPSSASSPSRASSTSKSASTKTDAEDGLRILHYRLDSKKMFSKPVGIHDIYGSAWNAFSLFLLLPPMFWFDVGEDGGRALREFGRGFVICLLFGVYFSAAVKDFLCLPRPLSPPVRRMTTKASIALEYGFPSTHTMNATSIALHTALQILLGSVTLFAPSSWADKAVGEVAGMTTLRMASLGLLIFYPVLMGMSRVVTGMHSFVDVVGGWWLGAGVVAVWWGGVGAGLERWIETGFACFFFFFVNEYWMSQHVPLVTITLLILAIYAHPNPEGPCPCFEDSVASISVVAGVIIGTWRHGAYGDGTSTNNTTIIGGIVRLLLGLVAIYAFRKIAKTLSKRLFSMVLGMVGGAAPVAVSSKGVEDNCDCDEGKELGEKKGRKVYIIPRVTVGTLTEGLCMGELGGLLLTFFLGRSRLLVFKLKLLTAGPPLILRNLIFRLNLSVSRFLKKALTLIYQEG
ncbi:hypothetical protein BC829DRAFT_437208 [Chytridium lagenaria]|nr:hypothetical protein BC829DRAFT_437208 [Chytridium lagenaria]